MSAHPPAWQEEWDRDLGPRMLEATHLSVWEVVRRSTVRFPDRPAIVEDGTVLTYAELVDAVLRCAAALQELGVKKGTRVAYLFGLSREWAIVHYALFRLGAVVVPVNHLYERDEMRSVLERSEAEVLITVDQVAGADQATKVAAIVNGEAEIPLLHTVIQLCTEGYRVISDAEAQRVFGAPGSPALDPRGPADGSDPATIYFTSGSTAAPKPALSAHRAHAGTATALGAALSLTEHDRWLAYTPTFHVGGGVWALAMPHAAGAASHFVPFDPVRALHTMENDRITAMGAFDIHFTRMMAVPEFEATDRSSVRKASIGVTPSFLERVESRWNFDVIALNYGSTESGGLVSLSPSTQPDGPVRRSANGVPLPGVEVAIKDPDTGQEVPIGEPGEICFRGWCQFIEYVGMPEETATAIDAQGYFHSGDYGWLDDEGNLYFRGRYKQMVKTGGENVAEREVEMFLESAFPTIAHAEVVGVPDEEWGEAVAAIVEFAEGASPRTPEQIRQECRGQIAGFKIPKHVIVVESGYQWPALDSGRTDKRELRRLAAEATQAGRAEDAFTQRHD